MIKKMMKAFCCLMLLTLFCVGASDLATATAKNVGSEALTVGDVSNNEFECFGEVIGVDETDTGVFVAEVDWYISTRTEKEYFTINDNEIYEYLKNAEKTGELKDNVYKFYLNKKKMYSVGKEDASYRNSNILIGIEKLNSKRSENISYPMYKMEDTWIFAQNIGEDKPIEYFGLEINNDFANWNLRYSLDDLFEDWRYSPVGVIVNDEGKIVFLDHIGDKKSIYTIERGKPNSLVKKVEGVKPIEIERKWFTLADSGNEASEILILDEQSVKDKTNISDSAYSKEKMNVKLDFLREEVKKGKAYIGDFVSNDDGVYLLYAREYSDLEEMTDEDVETIEKLSNLEDCIVIEEIDAETKEVKAQIVEDGFQHSWSGSIDLENEMYTLDYDNIKTSRIDESAKSVSKENVKLEIGQMIYLDEKNYFEKSINISGGLLIKNAKRKITEEFEDLELDLDYGSKFIVRKNNSFIHYARDEFEHIYDLSEGFDCQFVLDPKNTLSIRTAIIENAHSDRIGNDRVFGVVGDIEEKAGKYNIKLNIDGEPLASRKFVADKEAIEDDIEIGDKILAYYKDDKLLAYDEYEELKRSDGKYILKEFDEVDEKTIHVIDENGNEERLVTKTKAEWDKLKKEYEHMDIMIAAQVLGNSSRVDDMLIKSYEIVDKLAKNEKRLSTAFVSHFYDNDGHLEIDIYDYEKDISQYFYMTTSKLDVYELNVDDEKNFVMEYSDNELESLAKNYSVKKLNYEYEELDDKLVIAEFNGFNKLNALVLVDLSDIAVVGKVVDDQFVTNDGEKYDIKEYLLLGDENYKMKNFEEMYNGDVVAALIKKSDSEDYLAYLTKADFTLGDEKEAVMLVLKGRHGSIDINRYDERSEEGVLADGVSFETEGIKSGDIVIAKYNETNDEDTKVIKSMDLFYRPLADENQIIYKVKEIDGRDLKLETGDYRINDQNDIVIDNGVVKNFNMLKSATVFRDTSDSNLRVGEYINVKLDDNGDVELAYELEGLEIRKILLK
jgi:hypothetical protein